LVGASLGLFYFGGLWLTLRSLPESRHPALWVLGSFVGRLAVALTVFYGLIRWGGLVPAGIALVSFLGLRTVLVQRFSHFEPKRRSLSVTTDKG